MTKFKGLKQSLYILQKKLKIGKLSSIDLTKAALSSLYISQKN